MIVVFGQIFSGFRAWSDLADRSAHVELITPDGATLRCAWESLEMLRRRGMVQDEAAA